MELVLGLSACGLIIAAAFFAEAFQDVGPESPKWQRVVAYGSFAVLGLVILWLIILFVFIK